MSYCVDCGDEATFSILTENLTEIPLCKKCFYEFSIEADDQFCYVGVGKMAKLSKVLDMSA